MFERFTERRPRGASWAPSAEARSLGHGWIGTEHLLLAVAGRRGSPGVSAALRAARARRRPRCARRCVAERRGRRRRRRRRLRDLGIDLDAVRQRVEERFGAGCAGRAARRSAPRAPAARAARPPVPCGAPSRAHPRSPATAKKVLELALREALAQRSRRDPDRRTCVLGLMRERGAGRLRVVTRLGGPPDDVRRAVLRALGRAA